MATTTVFINNRSQAVRLPAELRLPDGVKKVSVVARGNERIISPLAESWNSFFIDGPVVSEDFMQDRGVQLQSERESF
ncbi:MAG: type II toxin-antitoxin system VapB family antitoxin [Methylophilaceae bacterium]|nr:type II toxin-antitoxin system VapB family antitoxin [Methylophilaceae bacterium]